MMLDKFAWSLRGHIVGLAWRRKAGLSDLYVVELVEQHRTMLGEASEGSIVDHLERRRTGRRVRCYNLSAQWQRPRGPIVKATLLLLPLLLMSLLIGELGLAE